MNLLVGIIGYEERRRHRNYSTFGYDYRLDWFIMDVRLCLFDFENYTLSFDYLSN